MAEQSTKYCKALSVACVLQFGLSQGNVLAPTIFSLYLNELLKTLVLGTTVVYADDVTIRWSMLTISLAPEQIQKKLKL